MTSPMTGPMTSPLTGALTAARPALLRLLAPPGPEDPYPDYALLREATPVHLADFGICFVSGYDVCRQVLGTPAFAVQDAAWFDTNTPDWRDHLATLTLYRGVQSRNPPDHTRMRRVLGGCFTPRRMNGLRARVTELADGLLDAMADAGSDGGAVDFMSSLAVPLPIAVISELLGVPEADRPLFTGVAGKIFNMMDLFVTDDDRRLADEATGLLQSYWRQAIAERRRAGRPAGENDVTGELTAAADAGLLTEDELLATLIFLFAAGYGTTAALLGNATAALLGHPDVARSLRADPGLVAAVVEETLRHESPTQIDPRIAVAETEVGGVKLPAGQVVIALLGAANRDPLRFPDPDRFDVGRSDRHVLSFGGGIHHCLGAPLSRMEASVVLPRLLARFPRLSFAGPPTRFRALRMRQFSRMPLSL